MLYRELNPDPGLYFPTLLATDGGKLGFSFGRDLSERLKSGNDNYSDDAETDDDLAYNEFQRLRAGSLGWTGTGYSGYLRERVKKMFEIHGKAFGKGYWDFTWLLEEGVRRESGRGILWSADYCAVDEINDLNPLQAQIVAQIRPHPGGTLEYVGDLDQAIYGFAGVNPQGIMQTLAYEGEIETMELSKRVPSEVAKRAEMVLGRASWRSPGHLKAEREGGAVSEIQALERIFGAVKRGEIKGSSYVLARTNWLVNEARAMARDMGLNIARTGEEDALKEFCNLLLNRPARISLAQASALTAKFLPAREFYQHGMRRKLLNKFEENPEYSLSLEDFEKNYAGEAMKRALRGEWREWYYGREFDPSKPMIRFDTFHASKGMEDEHVIILTDSTTRIEENGQKDEEIRLSYVALTRAREQVSMARMRDGDQNRWF